MNVTAGGAACERWDDFDVAEYPNAGLEDNNFCRNPDPISFLSGPGCKTTEGNWDNCNIPACDPCKCMPPCGQPIDETCPCHNVLQSQECCEENDSS